jgi:predicted AlkP superfamily pyrophosphatase or phosphodiesterase
MNKTVLILIDGLRADAIAQAATPGLDDLMETGMVCLSVQTVEPSLTLPAHFSIFTSLPPYSHGVVTNTAAPDMSAAAQSLFAHIKTLGGTTAAFYSWDHLRNLSFPGQVDYTLIQRIQSSKDQELLATAAARHLIISRPDFTFLYLEWADVMGHAHGWMSDAYLSAVTRCDQTIQKVVEAVHTLSRKGIGVHIVVASDHGGREKHHLSNHADTLTVPFIAHGDRIRPGGYLEGPMSVLDIAPTISRIMDIGSHPGWQGTVLKDIFRVGLERLPMFHLG